MFTTAGVLGIVEITTDLGDPEQKTWNDGGGADSVSLTCVCYRDQRAEIGNPGCDRMQLLPWSLFDATIRILRLREARGFLRPWRSSAFSVCLVSVLPTAIWCSRSFAPYGLSESLHAGFLGTTWPTGPPGSAGGPTKAADDIHGSAAQ